MSRSVSYAITLLSTSSLAWWDNGHMITARIAYDELLQRDPDTLTKANGILSQFVTKFEGDHQFVEAATFPDKFKYHGYEEYLKSPITVQGPWHFIDQAYFMGVPERTIPIKKVNVAHAISTLSTLIADGNQDGMTSYQLRCLIHYVGDIHQPLHATSMYSKEFPKGDRGGNSFQLKRQDGISELHALWDSVVTEYADDWEQPMQNKQWALVGAASTKIRNTFPRGRLFLTSNDPLDWAKESFDASTSFVYKNIEEHTWPSADYIKVGKMLAEERLAYGGYRLADLLSQLWGKKDQAEEEKFLW